MTRCPVAGSTAPTSPVRNQPSGVKAAAVAPASCQYPENTCGPRSWISPSAPGGASRPADQIRHSTPGSGSPTVSGRAAPSGCETSSPLSVVP